MTLPNLENVQPFFQPIIREDHQDVFAYEVLGRDVSTSPVRSLGPFFESTSVTDANKLFLDTHLRNLALEKYAASNSTAKLFLNVKPSWIYAQKDTNDSLPGLPLIKHFNINPQNIVIEITEEELLGDFDAFSRVLVRYRQAGCMLAIDDFGKSASSIERIAYVTPDIIKIDKSIVQRMDIQQAFFDICRAMNSFGDVSGFDLLFEGIETALQLERCIAAKGRYFQGFIFSQARPELDGQFDNYPLLCDMIAIQAHRSNVAIIKRNVLEKELSKKVENLLDLIPQEADTLSAPQALADLAHALPFYCLRCFVCDMDGAQLSSIFELGVHGLVTERKDRRSIWSRHDFFTFGLNALYRGHKHILSDIYKNVYSKENVATYMHKISSKRLLCIDIMSTILL